MTAITIFIVIAKIIIAETLQKHSVVFVTLKNLNMIFDLVYSPDK